MHNISIASNWLTLYQSCPCARLLWHSAGPSLPVDRGMFHSSCHWEAVLIRFWQEVKGKKITIAQTLTACAPVTQAFHSNLISSLLWWYASIELTCHTPHTTYLVCCEDAPQLKLLAVRKEKHSMRCTLAIVSIKRFLTSVTNFVSTAVGYADITHVQMHNTDCTPIRFKHQQQRYGQKEEFIH